MAASMAALKGLSRWNGSTWALAALIILVVTASLFPFSSENSLFSKPTVLLQDVMVAREASKVLKIQVEETVMPEAMRTVGVTEVKRDVKTMEERLGGKEKAQEGVDTVLKDRVGVGAGEGEEVKVRATAAAVVSMEEVLDDEGSTGGGVGHCRNGYVYVYKLPESMNEEILRSCSGDECEQLSHLGLGKANLSVGIDDESTVTGLFVDPSCWFKPQLFSLPVTYHARILQHPCRTTDPEKATAFYLPLYADIELNRMLGTDNETLLNVLPELFLGWLANQTYVLRNGGRDHFMLVGNNVFTHYAVFGQVGGTHLLRHPLMKNMTKLFTYRQSWDGTQMGVPYATFFHPSTEEQLRAWQHHVLIANRTWTASFVGSKKRGGTFFEFSSNAFKLREQLMQQCEDWERCGVVDCQYKGFGKESICHEPGPSLKMQLSSDFCLQPPGDDPPRKGTFDAMVAGCIPVFFSKESAHYQYLWHLPVELESYAVFIDEKEVRAGNLTVSGVLSGYSQTQIRAMRRLIIEEIMPKIIIADPESYAFKDTKDAVDVSVEGVLVRVRREKAGLRFAFPNPYDIEHKPPQDIYNMLRMPPESSV